MFFSEKINRGLPALAVAVCIAGCALHKTPEMTKMNFTDPNNYTGSDIERINAAIRDSRETGGIVRIFKRKPDKKSDRDFWLIDAAILLPEDTTLYITNCKIKLSDKARDNWIRSANCIVGNPEVKVLSNIHIIGEGSAVFEGADHPRATGDSGKTLGERTYGTDAGKKNRSQKGDWRNIGILLARVNNFSIKNLTLIDSHAWAVSLESCDTGLIRDLHFKSSERVKIDGKMERILNRDGLDLRRGCRNITIENITGNTGDDLIALTALGKTVFKSGVLRGTEFYGGSTEPGALDLFNISIRNVRGYCAGGHHIIRLLNNSGIKLYNIEISNLLDTSPEGIQAKAAIKIGDQIYGGSSPLGDTFDIQISKVHSKAKNAVLLGGSLKNSMISDVFVSNPEGDGVVLQVESVKTDGVILNNIKTAGKDGASINTVSSFFAAQQK